MKHHRRRSKKPPVERVLCSETGKREYEHYDDAVHVALKWSRRAGPLRIYECPSCGSWHLTKRPDWGKPPAN
ncbi:hypothetical protein CKJ85_01965 [Corynebacterium sp. NML 150383]|uniref:Uncharacterized protein n=1 Tax=Corynebacterium gottingense TaxID=2041036 RepID=A0ABX9UI89_9CORY|nr:hypothetical protein CKJ85_01965 [Corynebacterium sp. NML 150383]PAT15432.1 hypothetical protein CKJ84_03915 [Corynebacterium sp. NML 120412]RMD18563.1 hypothetical protein EAW56_08865 [Corynebacterium gottingense]